MSHLVELLSWCSNTRTILTFCAVFLLLHYGLNFLKQRSKLPPGPISLPLVGSLPNLVFNLVRTGDEPQHLFAKMAKQYGDVFSLKVGTKLIVVLNGCKSIKEAFQNTRMNDRASSRIFQETFLDEGTFLSKCPCIKSDRLGREIVHFIKTTIKFFIFVLRDT